MVLADGSAFEVGISEYVKGQRFEEAWEIPLLPPPPAVFKFFGAGREPADPSGGAALPLRAPAVSQTDENGEFEFISTFKVEKRLTSVFQGLGFRGTRT